jgi:oxygen-independent coproporphyrinogen-3 oxidase
MIKEKRSLSIYIHIPFCRKRCGYCDFNTYAGMDHLLNEYVDTVIKEITSFSALYSFDHIVQTIYFGGGTPTILPEDAYKKIIHSVKSNFQVIDDVEITSEANPANLGIPYLSSLQNSGINRLSIGMQSAIENELEILGRSQKLADVQQAVQNAREAGIHNINLDLIFGIPTQTLQSFALSIKEAVMLEPHHLSIYGLTLGESTQLANNIQMGLTPEINEDVAGDMYDWVMTAIPSHKYKQYEISNWALVNEQIDYRCAHNIQYWRNGDYLGIGAGAHSFVGKFRWHNLYSIPEYISGLKEDPKKPGLGHNAVAECNQLEKLDIIKETMMMRLRLTEEGVNLGQFKDRFSIEIEILYKAQIEKLISFGLIEYAVYQNYNVLRLTKKGRLVGNQVFLEFV